MSRSYQPDMKVSVGVLRKGNIFYEEAFPDILYVVISLADIRKPAMCKSLTGFMKNFESTTEVMYVRNSYSQR